MLDMPRNVVDRFIHSDDTHYMHPFLFCVAGICMVLIINSLFVYFTVEPHLLAPDIENDQVAEIAASIQSATVRISTRFLSASILFLLVPCLSVSGLFFFRNELEGFYSNLILNTYAAGAVIPMLVLMVPLWAFVDIPLSDPFMNTTLPGLLIAGAMLWIYKRYFHTTSLMDWVRTLSAYIAGYLLYTVLNGFAAGLIGYMAYAIQRLVEISG